MTSPQDERLRRKRILSAAAIVVLSLAINLSFFYTSPPQPPQLDSELYDKLARSLVGYGPSDKTPAENLSFSLNGIFVRGFLYPAFVGLTYKVAGSPNYRLVCFLQALILPFVVLLTYLLGVSIFDHQTALLSSLLHALYLPTIWHTNFLLVETLLAAMVTLTLWSLAVFLKREQTRSGVILGLLLGTVALSHSLWLFLPALILLLLAIRYRGTGGRWQVVWRLRWVVAGCAIVIVPWVAVDIGLGLPRLGQGGAGFGGGGGWGFYIGSRVETGGFTVPEDYLVAESYFPPGRLREIYEMTQKGEVTIEPILLEIIAEKLNSPDSKDWVLTDFDYYRAGIENWLHRPLQIPVLFWQKGSWYLFGQPSTPIYPLPKTIFFTTVHRDLFKALCWPLVLLAFGGLWVVAKHHRDKLIIFSPLIFQTFTVIMTYPEGRYAYPNLSAIFLLVALGVGLVSKTFRRLLSLRTATPMK